MQQQSLYRRALASALAVLLLAAGPSLAESQGTSNDIQTLRLAMATGETVERNKNHIEIIPVWHKKWHRPRPKPNRRKNIGRAIVGGIIAGAVIGGIIAGSREERRRECRRWARRCDAGNIRACRRWDAHC